MSVYLQDPDVTLWHGDALEVLRELEDESVDCVITSPPYWGLRDYGIEGQLGLEPTPEEYVARMVEVFREVRRVLASHGTCWVNLGSSYYSHAAKGGSGPDGKNEARWACGRASRRDAQRSGTVYTEPQDSTAPGCAYPDLCDECATALSLRTADNDQPSDESAQPLSLTDRGSERSDSSPEPLAASPLDAQESTNQRFSEQPPGECSHCANCGACLAVLRSFSRDAQMCARKETSTSGTSSPASDDHNQGTDAAGMAWFNYTSRLKQKDMVPIPWMVAMALQQDGWFLRSDIIWSKPNPMPESVTDRPTKSHEYLFLLSKAPRYWFDAEAVREPAEWARWGDQTVPKHGGTATGAGWIKGRPKHELQRPQARRAMELFEQAGLTEEHAQAIRAVGITDVGKAQVTQNGFGKNDPAVIALAQEAKDALGGYYREFLVPNGRNIRSVWEIATQPFPGLHFATFPEELVRRALLAGCPSRVRVCPSCELRCVEHNAGETEDHPAGSVPTVRSDVRGREATPAQILQSPMLSSMAGESEAEEDSHDQGIHLAASPRSSALGQARVHHGAPDSHGTASRTVAESGRGSASQERDQGRQPYCQSSSDAEAGTRQVAEETPEASTVPSLRGGDSGSPSKSLCSRCGTPTAEHPGVVLDPFAGSGTVSLVARKHNRRSIGIDLQVEYLAMAAKRLGQQSLFAEASGV